MPGNPTESPGMSLPATPPSALETLLVEQARLLARRLQQVADQAPHGHVLAAIEAAAVPAGRALTRFAVETLLQQQAEALEKKGRPAALAPTAADPPTPNDAARGTS